MFVQNLSILAIYVPSLLVVASASPSPQTVTGPSFIDLPFIQEITRVYGNEAAIPESLKKAIGSCKFN